MDYHPPYIQTVQLYEPHDVWHVVLHVPPVFHFVGIVWKLIFHSFAGYCYCCVLWWLVVCQRWTFWMMIFCVIFYDVWNGVLRRRRTSCRCFCCRYPNYHHCCYRRWKRNNLCGIDAFSSFSNVCDHDPMIDGASMRMICSSFYCPAYVFYLGGVCHGYHHRHHRRCLPHHYHFFFFSAYYYWISRSFCDRRLPCHHGCESENYFGAADGRLHVNWVMPP
mmetsp:Transcript_7920/g.12394  ORF Transcript_7920/g.12394 Transcript_7920/m.12394 type:complete len:220 (+) Transcript_7920:242-901(+)